MKATQELHDLGRVCGSTTLRGTCWTTERRSAIDEFSETGLTSNPTIFEHAISKSKSYDAEICRLLSTSVSGEELFFELAIQDLTRAADLFASVHERTAGNDGFVSLEVSPLLAYDMYVTDVQPFLIDQCQRRLTLEIRFEVGEENRRLRMRSHASLSPSRFFFSRALSGVGRGHMRGLERRIASGLEPRCAIGRFGLLEPVGRRDDG